MAGPVNPRRFEVWHVTLDPTRGSEIQKTRPCAVVSPDEMNLHLRTVIIAPLTTGGKEYPSRVPCVFGGVEGFVVLDQMRTVDRVRLVKRVGALAAETAERVCAVLVEMFQADESARGV